ncbi:MAG: nucleotidyl transferase AbiEii/AbiGii toxin family protein [Chloroflexi bacterium]|nr:nucleotidyl transferase AbiEii/AbiGii toxin family protein [Chloroflexota bacterium]
MPSPLFQSLSVSDQRDALEVAASRSGRPAHLLEKDIWVVQTLRALVEAPIGEHLTFKGGTSLSKAYQVIRRFSEDIDITHDIRTIAPDLVKHDDEEPLPATTSQASRWRREIETRLPRWVREQALPAVEANFAHASLSAQVRAKGDRLLVGYTPLFSDYDFVQPEVLVEFGARATGEPRERRPIACDAAVHVAEVEFPTTSPLVMAAERTFWEKATAVHVFCRQRTSGERRSRHWHDLVRLDDAGYGEAALADREVSRSVARHKSMFFRAKDAAGNWIDYPAAVNGDLQLVPDGPTHDALERDYARMVSNGMLLDDAEPFDDLMARCADLQQRANQAYQ